MKTWKNAAWMPWPVVLLVGLCVCGCTDTVPPADVKDDSAAESADQAAGSESVSEEFKTADSGLKFRILREGTGKVPQASDTVICHYKGELMDGTPFDSSYDRGEPATFPLRGVIPGWTEGLQYVREGGKIELVIPPNLGYGERGSPPVIPPGATLRFEVELIQVL